MLDTGVFVRFLVVDDVEHGQVREAVARLTSAGGFACFTSQIARESWSVLTRPSDVGGFGLSPERAAMLIGAAHREFKFLPDTANTYWRWLALGRTPPSVRQLVHDAYLAASLLETGLSRILSLDQRDFNRYEGIMVLHPSRV